MRKEWFIFVGVWIVCFSIQSWLWLGYPELLDSAAWIQTAQHFYEGSAAVLGEITYGYPGTPLLMMAWLGLAIGLSAQTAFVLSLAFFTSLGVAIIAACLALLKPDYPLWLPAAAVTGLSVHYFSATPPSMAVAPLLVASFCLLAVLAQRPRFFSVVLGIVVGLCLTIRIDVSGLAAVVIGIWLLWPARRRSFPVVVVIAAMTVILFDPYLRIMPVQHLSDIADKIFFHYTTLSSQSLSWRLLVARSPLAIIGLAAAAYLLFKPHVLPGISRLFLGVCLTFSALLTLFIFRASYRAEWYFFPIMLLGDVITVWCMVEMATYTPPARRHLYVWGCAVFFVLISAGLLYHWYTAPVLMPDYLR